MTFVELLQNQIAQGLDGTDDEGAAQLSELSHVAAMLQQIRDLGRHVEADLGVARVKLTQQ